MSNRFVVKPHKGKIMGVAAGLADYSGTDPLIIRLAFVVGALITGPIAILLYVLTGWLATEGR
ncbi:PspC domain-containing protein [Sphingomicrobium lutaoense]|uniref:Phage shock protein C n=1 Tax=Sphingomicrobium lutaoense TaxID=515949 RepID=A0A839Z3S2_9SPHN|nr:PspC domain-containing protein [Sphingomicrobium lutaoense]MBB3764737.1 phage shock protein C [Sphingomicrobium lutaoense]